MKRVLTEEFDIYMSDTQEYIINVLNVPITIDIMVEIIKINNDLSEQTGVTKVFSDVRNSRNMISMTDNYGLFTDQSKYKQLMDNRTTRVAILASLGDNSHYPPETFATNAGFSVRVFFEEELALKWLLI